MTSTTWARPELAGWAPIVLCWAALLIMAWVRMADRPPIRRAGALVIVSLVCALPAALLRSDQASYVLTLAVVIRALIGLSVVLARRRPLSQSTRLGLVLAVLVIGAMLRAERLSQYWLQRPPIDVDALEAYESSRSMVHPWQPAFRCPLWYLPVGVVSRLAGPDPYNVCWVSYASSLAAMLAIYAVTASWLHPLIGLVVMGGYALNPVAQAAAATGARADAYVALTYAVIHFLLVRRDGSWARFVWLGVTGGALLLLRQVTAVPMLAGWACGLAMGRSHWGKWLLALGTWIVLITPFYVSQRVFAPDHDAWRIEHRNVHVFARIGPPAGQSDPRRRELLTRLEGGEKIGPAEFLFRYHTAGQIVRAMGRGLWQVVAGEHFGHYVPGWWVCIVTAGAAGMLWSRDRCFVVYGLFSIFPIQAFLLGHYSLMPRLLVHVYPMWLTLGVWAIVRAAAIVARRRMPAADLHSVDGRL